MKDSFAWFHTASTECFDRRGQQAWRNATSLHTEFTWRSRTCHGEMPYIQHLSFRRRNCNPDCVKQRVEPIGKPDETSHPACPFFSRLLFETSRRFSAAHSLDSHPPHAQNPLTVQVARLITIMRMFGVLHVRLPACPTRNKPQTSQAI